MVHCIYSLYENKCQVREVFSHVFPQPQVQTRVGLASRGNTHTATHKIQIHFIQKYSRLWTMFSFQAVIWRAILQVWLTLCSWRRLWTRFRWTIKLQKHLLNSADTFVLSNLPSLLDQTGNGPRKWRHFRTHLYQRLWLGIRLHGKTKTNEIRWNKVGGILVLSK